ncbi:unnamed protein product, partial [Durusdinium trenchii]
RWLKRIRFFRPKTIHMAYKEEPPKIASDGVEVRFEVEKKTNHGEEVFVCGGTDALGNWDVRHARPLCCETTYPYWRAVIHFDSAEAGKTIAYKYLVQSSSQEPKWEDSPNRSLHLLELPRYRLQRLGTYLSPGEEGPEQDKTEEEDKAGIAVPGSFFGIAGKAASQSWVNKSFIDFEQKLHHIQDLAEKTQEQQKRLQSDYDNLLQKQLQTKELENLQRRQDSMDKHSEQSARELEELQRRQDSMDKEQSDRLQKLEEEVAKDVSQVRRQLHDLRTQRTGTSVKTQVAPPEALYKVKLEELLKETGLKQRLSKLESNNELSRIRFRLMSLEQRFHHAGTLQQKLGESHGVQSVKGRSVPLSTGQTLGRTLGRTCSPARNHAASCNGIMEHCPQLEALQQQMEGTTQAQASLQAQVAGEFAMYSQKIESLEAACAKHGREMAEAHTSFSEQQKFQDGTVQLIQDEVRYVQVIARKIDRVDCKADDLSTRMAAQKVDRVDCKADDLSTRVAAQKEEFEGAHTSLKAQLESQADTVQEIQDEVSHAQEFAKKVDSKADELSTRFQRVDGVVQKIQDEVCQVQEIARKVDRVDCKADDLSTRVAAQKEEFEGAHNSLKAQLESQYIKAQKIEDDMDHIWMAVEKFQVAWHQSDQVAKELEAAKKRLDEQEKKQKELCQAKRLLGNLRTQLNALDELRAELTAMKATGNHEGVLPIEPMTKDKFEVIRPGSSFSQVRQPGLGQLPERQLPRDSSQRLPEKPLGSERPVPQPDPQPAPEPAPQPAPEPAPDPPAPLAPQAASSGAQVFSRPPPPEDPTSRRLTEEVELDLLKAQDERLSVEKRSTLLKKVQLKLHPDKGGTDDAQIWLTDWLREHLDWYFEPHNPPEELKKKYAPEADECVLLTSPWPKPGSL